MRTQLFQHADATVGVAERHEILAEQTNLTRGAAGFECIRLEHRIPVAPQQRPAERFRSDAGDQFVLFFAQHTRAPPAGRMARLIFMEWWGMKSLSCRSVDRRSALALLGAAATMPMLGAPAAG